MCHSISQQCHVSISKILFDYILKNFNQLQQDYIQKVWIYLFLWLAFFSSYVLEVTLYFKRAKDVLSECPAEISPEAMNHIRLNARCECDTMSSCHECTWSIIKSITQLWVYVIQNYVSWVIELFLKPGYSQPTVAGDYCY